MISSSSLKIKAGQVNFHNLFNFQQMRLFSKKFREESDTFGPLQVPADKYWGA